MPEILLPTDYKPWPKQILAHNTPARWTLYGGGEGGGKTRWMVEEIVRLMTMYPGIEGVCGRLDQNDVFQATQIYDAFHRYCPPELIPTKGGEYRSYPRWTRFHNGSRVTWTGFKDYSPSAEYGFAAIDQAEEVEMETLQLLNGRLRQRLPNGMFPHFRMLLTCNPHPNIEWFRKRVEEFPNDYIFVESLHSDNTFLPADFKEQRRKSYTPENFERLIEGSWDAFAGQALVEWNPDLHVVRPFDDWWDWDVWLGVDFGTDAPTVGEWIAVSPDGHLFFTREYERVGAGPAATSADLVELSQGMNLRGVWLDPNTTRVKADLNRRVTWSVWDEYIAQFKKIGVPVHQAKASRLTRLAAWQQAIHPNYDLVDFRTETSPAPTAYVFETCRGLVHTLPRLQYAKVQVGESEDIVKKNDHWYDAGGFVLTHLLKTTTPYFQVRNMNVKMNYGTGVGARMGGDAARAKRMREWYGIGR